MPLPWEYLAILLHHNSIPASRTDHRCCRCPKRISWQASMWCGTPRIRSSASTWGGQTGTMDGRPWNSWAIYEQFTCSNVTEILQDMFLSRVVRNSDIGRGGGISNLFFLSPFFLPLCLQKVKGGPWMVGWTMPTPVQVCHEHKAWCSEHCHSARELSTRTSHQCSSGHWAALFEMAHSGRDTQRGPKQKTSQSAVPLPAERSWNWNVH